MNNITLEEYESAMELAVCFEQYFDIDKGKPEDLFYEWIKASAFKGILLADKIKSAKRLYKLSNQIIVSYLTKGKK